MTSLVTRRALIKGALAIGAAAAAGTLPDIVYMQGWEWQPYAIAGTLRPMDNFIKRDRAHLPNIWPAAYHPQTKWNGKTYMAPADTGPMVMFYNKEMFDKARVPY